MGHGDGQDPNGTGKRAIAVMNHAVGGKPINFFLKGDTTNFGLNYTRLLYRLQAAGLRRGLSGICWYQGESDAYSAVNAFDYEGRFYNLHRSFQEDFGNPRLRGMFVAQTRPGCGGNEAFHNIIGELMRRAQDSLPDVWVVSTNGLDGHDFCHFNFSEGYEPLGFRMGFMIRHRLYGFPAAPGVLPPDVVQPATPTLHNP